MFFQELGIAVSIVLPPEGAEPTPCKCEAPVDFAVRAAKAKATSLLPGLIQGQAGFLLPLPSEAAPLQSIGHIQPSDGEIYAGARKLHGIAALQMEHSLDWQMQELGIVIIAADTIVVSQGVILGKPKDAVHAMEMLSSLAGQEHEVVTGCSLLTPHGHVSFACQTSVRMWDCGPETLQAYMQTGEPMDKAGAYAIQGAGAFLIESIQGSWSNVVGLPVAEMLQLLLALGCLHKIECS